ncbi:uncharacterized protein LOC144091013 [Stigmatopora argus]
MLLFHLVLLALLALLATSRNNGEPSPNIWDQWTFPEDELQDAELDELFRKSSQDYIIEMLPTGTPESDGVTPPWDYDNLLTTARRSLLKTLQDEKKTGSAAWKTAVVVVASLLLSAVGCVSLVYYLCVWRGGRIHYQPHKVEA